ncbi:Uma2 family endonuclease [Enterovirga aerilata]|uniref:Uma2 family endonuclease n=1 Tax=Enterovirga aerilata TaxID=2730920 RepID=A0A849IG31_9HYPH|nr:Uma2 family endonuclease [Enterovirga sp. DB1703]NNM74907.1 Uma2 family endonuclease [Enterovirga sp. DB1703]
MTVHVTRALDGFSRRAFSVAEFERMFERGILDDSENLELIEGEIVPMAAKSHVHERVKSAILLVLARELPRNLWLGVESSLEMSEMTLVEPDLVIYPKSFRLREVRGPDILLAVEVADTSFRFDRDHKARLYARYGVQELWVVEANSRTTYIHREPRGGAWTSIAEVPASGLLQPGATDLQHIAFRLGELD